MTSGDTIAAIATAPGRAGVAVVRVSGPDALEVAERVTGRRAEPGCIRFARFADADEGLLLAFAAPHSYTGEDVVELQGHGGAVAPQRVLEACLAAGARLARRGEFTERAFLNGKLDYDQAESVLDLIEARTKRAAEAALDGLRGRRRQALRDLYEEALSFSVELEHALDVSEEELPEGFGGAIRARLAVLSEKLKAAVVRLREGKILRAGALVVLAGPPNAGKSSLMNALLEENRAIVSDVPGTTRDSIEEWMDLGGWPIRLVDTAGLRDTTDSIEAEGVRRSEALIARADIVLALGGADGGPNGLAVHAKCDLGHGPGLNVSAKTGEGLADLKAALVARLAAKAESGCGADESSDDRLLSAALEAGGQLSEAEAVADDLVLLGNRMRRVAETLGAPLGMTYSADLLDRLFSRFCVGK